MNYVKIMLGIPILLLSPAARRPDDFYARGYLVSETTQEILPAWSVV